MRGVEGLSLKLCELQGTGLTAGPGQELPQGWRGRITVDSDQMDGGLLKPKDFSRLSTTGGQAW